MAFDSRPVTLEALVDRCCSEYLVQADWEKNMQLLDLIKRKPDYAKPITKLIRKKWKVKKGMDRVALLAITLLETLAKNDWFVFLEVHDAEYQQALQRLATQKTTHYTVKDKLAEFVKSCAETTRNDVRFPNFEKTYQKLRQKSIAFPTEAPSFSIPVEPRTRIVTSTIPPPSHVAQPRPQIPSYAYAVNPQRRPSSSPTNESRKPVVTAAQLRQSIVTKLDEDTPKITLVREMLLAIDPKTEEVMENDLIVDLMKPLKTLHGQIEEWLTGGHCNEELMARLLETNDALLQLFQAQEDLQRGLVPRSLHGAVGVPAKRENPATEVPSEEFGELEISSSDENLRALEAGRTRPDRHLSAAVSPLTSSFTSMPSRSSLIDDLLSLNAPSPAPAPASPFALGAASTSLPYQSASSTLNTDLQATSAGSSNVSTGLVSMPTPTPPVVTPVVYSVPMMPVGVGTATYQHNAPGTMSPSQQYPGMISPSQPQQYPGMMSPSQSQQAQQYPGVMSASQPQHAGMMSPTRQQLGMMSPIQQPAGMMSPNQQQLDMRSPTHMTGMMSSSAATATPSNALMGAQHTMASSSSAPFGASSSTPAFGLGAASASNPTSAAAIDPFASLSADPSFVATPSLRTGAAADPFSTLPSASASASAALPSKSASAFSTGSSSAADPFAEDLPLDPAFSGLSSSTAAPSTLSTPFGTASLAAAGQRTPFGSAPAGQSTSFSSGSPASTASLPITSAATSTAITPATIASSSSSFSGAASFSTPFTASNGVPSTPFSASPGNTATHTTPFGLDSSSAPAPQQYNPFGGAAVPAKAVVSASADPFAFGFDDAGDDADFGALLRGR